MLVVDDDSSLRRLLEIRLASEGFEVRCAASALEALSEVEASRPDVVVSDLRMEPYDGLWLLAELHRRARGLPILMLSAHGTVPDAVRALESGASGFLTKPVDGAELVAKLRQILRVNPPAEAVAGVAPRIVGGSPQMSEIFGQVRRAAIGDSTVLIRGESGVGKELVARAVHDSSPRREQGFFAVNCGAIPEGLVESELFGHERGAFSGAERRREGLFAAADRGTLFLDEVGELPVAIQAKLLRVLEEREVRRVGGNESFPVDVRIVAATNRDLEREVADGRFREDLFYRLEVVVLEVPPLRERPSDIPPLVEHFLDRLAKRDGRSPSLVTPEGMELLVGSAWPGNVRQLRNVVERFVALATGPVIGAAAVQDAIGEQPAALRPLAEARDEFTRSYLEQLLRLTSGNVRRAAELAGRNRTEFYKLLARHGVHSSPEQRPVASRRQT